jgi:ribosome-associated toxin RatA of RatAB toxin-antitoxin module
MKRFSLSLRRPKLITKLITTIMRASLNAMVLSAALSVSLISSVALLHAAPTLTPAGSIKGLSSKVRGGDVEVKTYNIKGSEMPKIIAFGVIKAPIKTLWGLVVDCANYKNTMGSVKVSKLISGSEAAGKMRCELVADLPWPMDDLRSVVDITFKRLPNGVLHRSWTLVEGDYKANTGSWTMTPIDEGAHTLLRYELHAEPHTSVPQWLKKKAAKVRIPAIFERLKEEADKRAR